MMLGGFLDKVCEQREGRGGQQKLVRREEREGLIDGQKGVGLRDGEDGVQQKYRK